MQTSKQSQRGISFTGLLFGGAALVFVAIFAMKLIPAYVHSAQISQILREVAGDPALRGASVKEIELSYNKRADINGISDLKADDIVIENDDGSLILSANYFVKVPLAGNVTLMLEFNPSSR